MKSSWELRPWVTASQHEDVSRKVGLHVQQTAATTRRSLAGITGKICVWILRSKSANEFGIWALSTSTRWFSWAKVSSGSKEGRSSAFPMFSLQVVDSRDYCVPIVNVYWSQRRRNATEPNRRKKEITHGQKQHLYFYLVRSTMHAIVF